jgi:hypothetical protein
LIAINGAVLTDSNERRRNFASAGLIGGRWGNLKESP